MSKNKALKEFEIEIEKAIRIIFPKIKIKLSSEKLYAFGIFFSNGFEYFQLAANTNEGNIKKTKEYLEWYKKEFNKDYDKNFDETLKQLKWNFGDWEYYNDSFMEEFDNQFSEAHSIITTLTDKLDNINIDKFTEWQLEDYYEEYDQLFENIINSTIKVFKKLDNDGLFGKGRNREKITLCVSTFNLNYNICEYINSEKNFMNLIKELKEGDLYYEND